MGRGSAGAGRRAVDRKECVSARTFRLFGGTSLVRTVWEFPLNDEVNAEQNFRLDAGSMMKAIRMDPPAFVTLQV